MIRGTAALPLSPEIARPGHRVTGSIGINHSQGRRERERLGDGDQGRGKRSVRGGGPGVWREHFRGPGVERMVHERPRWKRMVHERPRWKRLVNRRPRLEENGSQTAQVEEIG